MSLKTFHIIFVILSTLLSVGFAMWAVGQYLDENAAGYLVVAFAAMGCKKPVLKKTPLGDQPQITASDARAQERFDAALDLLEARFRELHWGELSGTNELSGIAEIELGQGRIRHRCHGLNLPQRRATDPTRLAGAGAFRRNCGGREPTFHLTLP